MTDAEAALAAYQRARYVTEARHESYAHVIGCPGEAVSGARARLDRAEDRAWHRRRAWWPAVAWERQNPTKDA
jgi:hypothetical protein